MKRFFNEFKDFALRGNAFELAIGVVIGGAFTAIVNSLANNIISPVVGIFVPYGVMDSWVIPLNDSGAQIDIGNFVESVISFIITAFVIFLMIKSANRLNRNNLPEAEETPPPVREEVLLLREIVEELKKQ